MRMPSHRDLERLVSLSLISLFVLGCGWRDAQTEVFTGPIYINQSGVELKSSTPLSIRGEKNRIEITVPAGLHPNYSRLKFVDSTDSVTTEVIATVELSSGKNYTFRAHGLRGVPGHPEQLLDLVPDDTASPRGGIRRITLKSTQPVVVPRIEWQSWTQGL